MTPFNEINQRPTPQTLITGDPIPERCPLCNAPRWAIEGSIVAFTCHSTMKFLWTILGESRPNPKLKQTLKCIALAKAGGWKRDAA